MDRDRYELIAGERRWRAAQMAGLEEVPALVREVPDEAALAMSLIENIQRENLNPMEEAAGMQRLVDEFKMTHEQAADAVGRSRSATTNLLRLLKLRAAGAGDADGRRARDGARARAARARRRAADRGRQARRGEGPVGARNRGAGAAARCAARRRAPQERGDRDLARLEEEVSERLGTTVEIRAGRKGTGKVVVHYSSLDHLDQLLKKLR